MLFEQKTTGSEGGCHANMHKGMFRAEEKSAEHRPRVRASLLHLRNSKEADKTTERGEEESSDV